VLYGDIIRTEESTIEDSVLQPFSEITGTY